MIAIPPRESWNPIEEALYGPDDLYRVEAEEADRLKLQAIRFSFNHHYSRNRFYRDVCNHRGVKPSDVKTLDDLNKIPLIPDNIFKGYPEPEKFIAWLRGISSDDVKYPSVTGSSYEELIDRINEHGFRIVFSSGSSGRLTFIPRDRITLSRLGYFEVKRLKQLMKFNAEEDYRIWFGSDFRKSGHWSLGHWLGGLLSKCREDRIFFAMDSKITPSVEAVGQLAKTQTIEEDSYFKVLQVLEDLSKKESKGVIGGVHFLINKFLSKMEELGNSLTLGDDWRLHTGGLRWEHVGITYEDFRKKVGRVLGIPDKNCLEAYGMTESVVTFYSCSGHYFHIPPTLLHPFVLDSNLEPMDFEESGRFAFIDTLAHGYPCYIITGDQVKLLESCPSCDRTGPVITPPVTRITGVEDRGCINVARRLMIEELDEL